MEWMCEYCVLTGRALSYLLVDSCDLHLEALREAQLVLQLDIRDRLRIGTQAERRRWWW